MRKLTTNSLMSPSILHSLMPSNFFIKPELERRVATFLLLLSDTDWHVSNTYGIFCVSVNSAYSHNQA